MKRLFNKEKIIQKLMKYCVNVLRTYNTGRATLPV